jgi:hypothetical protein
MSGVTANLATLFNYSATSASGADPFLSIVYGGGAATPNSPAGALAALQQAEANEAQDVAQVAAQPAVARDIANFTAAVNSATSVQALLANPTVLKVLLTANGLADQIPYTALAQQALMSNPADPNSVANQLSGTNSNWEAAATSYNFYANGLTNIQNPTTIASIANSYAETVWRTSLDATTPGLSNALTFRESASAITSVLGILGNSVTRDVVTTTLGLPLQIAIQPLEAQERAISSNLDIANFQNPQYVDQFIQQYLIAKANAAATSATSTNPFSVINSLIA